MTSPPSPSGDGPFDDGPPGEGPPGDLPSGDRIVAVCGSSSITPDDPETEDAERCGRLLAEAGFVVATGGYGGMMAAVSRGAASAGGTVIGVTAPTVFPTREGANPWVSEERPAPTITARLDTLLSGATAVVVLPGAVGTLTELVVAWNRALVEHLAGTDPVTVVTVGRRWAEILEALAAGLGLADRAPETTLVTRVSTVDRAVAHVVERSG